jgi:hypothetical protein
MEEINWDQYSDEALDFCNEAAMEILNLQRFYHLARLAVQRFPADGETAIPWQLSDVEAGLAVHPGDEEDLIQRFWESCCQRIQSSSW